MGVCFTTQQATRKVVERFGKFNRLASPGIGFLWVPCCVERIAGTVNMRQQQLICTCETKSKDNTFVVIEVSVQYRVLRDKIYDSFYELDDSEEQIRAYVYDVVRSEIPKVSLDDVFLLKEELSAKIKKLLDEMMSIFGFEIVGAPVTNIDPAPQVKMAMNEINKAERMKQAAFDEGEAAKILAVKKAEANAESIRIEARAEADAKHLSGQGLARQRQAIVDGLQESVKIFQEGVADVASSEVMDVILLTQYFDTMKDIGTSSARGTNVMFMSHDPGHLSNLKAQVRSAVSEGNIASSFVDGKSTGTLSLLPGQVEQ